MIRQSDSRCLNAPTLNAVLSVYWSSAHVPRDTSATELMSVPVAPAALTNALSIFADLPAGITGTIVEEILRTLYLSRFGSSIWEEMKNETEGAFGPNPDVFGDTAVIEELVKLIHAQPQLSVMLLGHSTGAVYIGNFLQNVDAALDADGNDTFDLMSSFMAAADTFTFSLINYLRRRVRALRAFGMTDQTEQRDLLMSSDVAPIPMPPILGKVYPHSLLYLISGTLETFAPSISSSAPHDLDTLDMPIFGMDRFFGANDPLDASNYPDIESARLELENEKGSNLFMRVLSPTSDIAPPGQRCQAQKHGGFPLDPQMVDSLRF